MLKILFVRHGLSEGNQAKVYCGQSDVKLNKQGLQQGEKVSEYIYANYKVQSIYTSALSRTYQTIQKLVSLTGIKPIALKDFNERDIGVWTGHGNDYIKEHWQKDFELDQKDSYLCVPEGAESYAQVYERVVRGLKRVIEDCDNREGVAVVSSHGGALKLLECYMRNIPIESSKTIRTQSNASITEVIYDEGKFEITFKGYDEYLKELKSTGLINNII